MNKIFFSINDKYAHHLAVALCSLYTFNNVPLKVSIIYRDLKEINIKKLKNIAYDFGQVIEFIQLEKNVFNNLIERDHFSRDMYTRFLVPYFAGKSKFSIYLDADILVLADIQALLNFELESEFICGAVSNPSVNEALHKLGFPQNTLYYDSGLLIFDNLQWKRKEIFNKLMNIIEENKYNLSFPDNDALNLYFKGNVQQIPIEYSYQSQFYKDPHSANKYSEIKPFIIQFAGALKPDSYLSSDNFKLQYEYFIKKTPFNLHYNSDKSWKLILVRLVRRLIQIV